MRRLPLGDGPLYRRGSVRQGLDDRGADALAEGDAYGMLGADRVRSQRPPLLDVPGEQFECALRGCGGTVTDLRTGSTEVSLPGIGKFLLSRKGHRCLGLARRWPPGQA